MRFPTGTPAVVCVVAVMASVPVAMAQPTITNPDYNGDITGWSVAQYTTGSGMTDWAYATAGLSITGPRSAPGMAKSEWSGHNTGNCSIYQGLTGVASTLYTISVYGQVVNSTGTGKSD